MIAAETHADPPGERQPGTVFQPFGGVCKANLTPSRGNTASRLVATSPVLQSWSARSRQEQHKDCEMETSAVLHGNEQEVGQLQDARRQALPGALKVNTQPERHIEPWGQGREQGDPEPWVPRTPQS